MANFTLSYNIVAAATFIPLQTGHMPNRFITVRERRGGTSTEKLSTNGNKPDRLSAFFLRQTPFCTPTHCTEP